MTILTKFAVGLLLLITTRAAVAENWARFRGDNGTGQAGGLQLHDFWEGREFTWVSKLPGIGHSSPVVWDGQVFVTSAEPETGEQHFSAIDVASGEEIWKRSFPHTTYKLHAQNSFASSTPAIDGERLYLAWAAPEEGNLIALSHDGQEIMWRVALGPFDSWHGFGSSPIVIGDNVYLSYDQRGDGYLISVDAASGDINWKLPRTSGNTPYAAPTLATLHDGSEQLVFNSDADGMVGVDPATGNVIWQLEGVFPQRCVSSVVYAGGLLFGTSGQAGKGVNLIAVNPGNGDQQEAYVKYEQTRQIPYVPTPLPVGERLFLWSDQGLVRCLDLASGDEHWRRRVGGGFHGSPILIGDQIVAVSDTGELIGIAAGEKFRETGRRDLGESSRATPAVAGGRLFIRTESQLFCYAPRQANGG